MHLRLAAQIFYFLTFRIIVEKNEKTWFDAWKTTEG